MGGWGQVFKRKQERWCEAPYVFCERSKHCVVIVMRRVTQSYSEVNCSFHVVNIWTIWSEFIYVTRKVDRIFHVSRLFEESRGHNSPQRRSRCSSSWPSAARCDEPILSSRSAAGRWHHRHPLKSLQDKMETADIRAEPGQTHVDTNSEICLTNHIDSEYSYILSSCHQFKIPFSLIMVIN